MKIRMDAFLPKTRIAKKNQIPALSARLVDLSFVLVFALALFFNGAADASTLTVTNANDSGPGSLRDTIAAASAGDTINFNGDYTITLASTLTITTNLTIDGETHSITISGNSSYRVFYVSAGVTASLLNLTVSGGSADSGGGVYNAGTLNQDHCTFTGNSAVYDGGAIYNSGTLTITNSAFSGPAMGSANNASSGNGGAICNSAAATLTVTGCTFTNNDTWGGTSTGGAIYSDGILTVADSAFIGNFGYWAGGAVYSDAGGALTVTGSTFQDNQAYLGGGGAISSSGSDGMVTDCVFSGNVTIFNGGGIINFGSLTVRNSTFSANKAETTITGWPSMGGAIFSRGPLTVSGSTFEGNQSSAPTGGYGGAVAAGNTEVILTNNTFVSNSATSAGGAVYAGSDSVSALNLTNNTLAENTATSGNSIYYYEQGLAGTITVNLYNNILLAGAAGGNCASGGIITTTASNNLADDATCGAGFTNSSSILLGTLDNYGGPTQTIPLLPGSSAIDAGDDATCASTDQRGITRPQGSHCDIGAFEVVPITFTTSSSAPLCSYSSDGSITISASGGTGMLTYSVDNGSTFQASDVFNSIAGGTYNIAVEDMLGFTSTGSVTLTSPPAISLAPTGTNPSCNGSSDGSISITASGGTGTLAYSDDGGSTFQSPNNFTGLSAGTYNLSVKDANKCVQTGSATLTDPPALTVTTNPSSQTVFFGNSVSFTAAASGSPAPSVKWQSSSDGTTWGDISGATGASYSFTPTMSDSGKQFHALFTNTCASVATTAATLTVNKADQATLTLNAGSPLTYGSTETLSTTGGSGTGAVTYSAGISTGCSVTGSTLSVTNAGGTCSVTAMKAADANYNQATSSAVIVTLQEATQTISITTPAPGTATYKATFNVAATSSSGLPVAITTSGSCSGSGTGSATITMTSGTGTCTVYYDQGGNDDYSAASELSDMTTASYPTHVVMPDATGNGNIILDAGNGCAFTSWGKETSAQAGNDPAYNYPYGLVEFTLNCSSADVAITFPNSLSGMTYRKYGPTPLYKNLPENPNPHWYDFMYDNTTGAQISGNQAVLHFVDGQRGDDDLQANGVVVDAGGPAQPNGNDAVAVPTMTEWGMLAFLVFAGAGAAYSLGKRRRTAG